MTDRKGDPEKKRAADCADLREGGGVCQHLKETGGGFTGERYDCDQCGETYKLYYEDMA